MARKTTVAPPPTEPVALANWSVRHRSPDVLPEADRATYDAVVSALAHYEVGEDADALEVVNRIERLGGAPRIPAPETAAVSALQADSLPVSATAPSATVHPQRLPSARHAAHSS